MHEHPNLIVSSQQAVQTTRQLISDQTFIQNQRTKPKAFMRERKLPFRHVAIVLLQKTVRSLQLHLHDFFDRLLGPQAELSITPSAWTLARAKFKHTAFIELNEEAILKVAYGVERSDFEVRRWRGFRVMGVDSSVIRLPVAEELGEEFGWRTAENNKGKCGRYPEARLSGVYDVCNQLMVHARLERWEVGERALAEEQLELMAQEDMLFVLDRGYASYRLFTWFVNRKRHFLCRCAKATFGIVDRLFEENIAGRSVKVTLRAPNGTLGEIRESGLPEETEIRFVTHRLKTGELEVLATSLLDEENYPTEAFGELYWMRWGIETYYGLIKSRLDLENFTGRTVEAVRQDVFATIFLSNFETLIRRPMEKELVAAKRQGDKRDYQVNRAVSFHAIKMRIIELLLSQQPADEVVAQVQQLFLANPVSIRKNRNVFRRKRSGWRSYQYQRNTRKTVF